MFYYGDTRTYLRFVYAFMKQNGGRNGGAVMWDRLLLAIDQFESGQAALTFTMGIATATEADVRVMHVRELSNLARVPPLETLSEADALVGQAVFSLRRAGIEADGRACSFPQNQVPFRIVEESMFWVCDAIVLGTRRLHGASRLYGRGVRERVLRLSVLPVVAAPNPLIGPHSLGRSRGMARNEDWTRHSHPGRE
jgi:nucleotide-binding universal stress UspA family protein